jgi:dienelactone hydrolase
MRVRVAASCLAVLALAGVIGASSPAGTEAPRVTIEVSPTASFEDQPLQISVGGLPADAVVSLRLQSVDANNVLWEGLASYRADAAGRIDLADAAALSGTYGGVWSMGLLASMHPVEAGAAELYFWWKRGNTFTLSVSVGGALVGKTTFTRGLGPDRLSVHPQDVTASGFDGDYITPIRPGRHAAILVLGGSGGGMQTLLAASLAAHGYPALALAYFKEPGLPPILKNIPLEYFARALRWLDTQPQVDPNHVLVLGVSRGSEAALLTAVHYPQLVHGVIASVPSDVALGCDTCSTFAPAWTFDGKPVPWTDQFDNPAPTDNPAAVIPVERIHGPMFLDCAGEDETWVSCTYADAIVRRLTKHHFRFTHMLDVMPNAGHSAGALVPFEPEAEGDPTFVANEHARETVWPRLLSFLARYE